MDAEWRTKSVDAAQRAKDICQLSRLSSPPRRPTSPPQATFFSRETEFLKGLGSRRTMSALPHPTDTSANCTPSFFFLFYFLPVFFFFCEHVCRLEVIVRSLKSRGEVRLTTVDKET